MNRTFRMLVAVVAAATLTIGLVTVPASAQDDDTVTSDSIGGYFNVPFCAEIRGVSLFPPPKGDVELLFGRVSYDGTFLEWFIAVSVGSSLIQPADGFSIGRFAVLSTPGLTVIRLGEWVFGRTSFGLFEARVIDEPVPCVN